MPDAVANETVTLVVKSGHVPVLTGLEEDRPRSQVALEITFLALLWLFSVLGNVLVCLVIYRSRRVQSTTNYFVMALALADIMLSLFCVPVVASRVLASAWPTWSTLCRIVRFLQYLSPTTTIYVLVSICIDRFYSIIYPLSFKITRGTAKRMAICCWLLAVFCSSFALYFFETSEAPDSSGKLLCPTYIQNRHWGGILYGTVLVLITFLVPTLVVVVVYYRIFRYIWRAGVGRHRLRRTMNPVPRTKVKMVKMLIIVTAFTLLLFAPWYGLQVWYTASGAVYVNPTVFIAVFWLLYATTVCKPVIYVCYNANFRRGCKEVFCMSTMRCYRSSTYAITTASNFSKKNHVGILPSDVRPHPLDSPSRTFNRASLVDRTAWPMPATISSTCL